MCAERAGAASIAACTRVISSGKLDRAGLAMTYALRGAAHRNGSEYELALADFTQTITLLEGTARPEVVASAYVTRAAVYALKGDVETALQDYRKALALDGKNAQAAEGIRQVEAALATPAVRAPPQSGEPAQVAAPPPARPIEKKASPDPRRKAQSNFACCLAYYRGEVSLEGWGPAERCRHNVKWAKNFCSLLRQNYPDRAAGL